MGVPAAVTDFDEAEVEAPGQASAARDDDGCEVLQTFNASAHICKEDAFHFGAHGQVQFLRHLDTGMVLIHHFNEDLALSFQHYIRVDRLIIQEKENGAFDMNDHIGFADEPNPAFAVTLQGVSDARCFEKLYYEAAASNAEYCARLSVDGKPCTADA